MAPEGEQREIRAGIGVRIAAFIFGMTLFVLGWWWVVARDGVNFSFVIWIIAGMAGIAIVTALWITWNLRIHRVKGPRRAPRDPGPLPPIDQLGRLVVVGQGASTAPRISLTVIGDEVTITAVDAE